MQTNYLGYDEKRDDLSKRIEIHKKYSNFSLEDWLEEKMPVRNGDCILDVGCGSGNFFPVYSDKLGQTGLIVGLDRSAELLGSIDKNNACTPISLIWHDINNTMPFIDNTFNFVISTFAIYYVEYVENILVELNRVVKKDSQCLLIGPTKRNAGELYTLNKKIFGIEMDKKVMKRTSRLEDEFFPTAKNIFDDVSIEFIQSKLIFPSKDQFLNYYCSTPLFSESQDKLNKKINPQDINLSLITDLEVSKEMVALWLIK